MFAALKCLNILAKHYDIKFKGVNIVAVSKILGHADLKTTMKYAHPDNSLKEAVELLTQNSFNSVSEKFTDSGNFEK